MTLHTHGGTDAPECTTCSDPHRPTHRGEPRRCWTCGKPEDAHNVRHPFTHPAYQSGLMPAGARAPQWRTAP